MKILLTGGAGFIGSNFIDYWFSKHPQDVIVVLDKLTYAGRMENINHHLKNKNFKFIKGDICDAKIVRQALDGVNIVIHMAAESHNDRSIVGAPPFIQSNFTGTYVMLEESVAYGKLDKFLMFSTDEVYGDKSSLDEPASLETDAFKPSSPYSASKAAADLLAFSYYRTFKLPVIISRANNNYGPRQFPEKFIPRAITNLIEGKKIPLMGEGKNMRDWIHVDDTSSAVEVLLEKGKIGEAYNISAHNLKTNKEIANKLLSIFKLTESKGLEIIPHRLGHDFIYNINDAKLRKLGWKPKISFEQGFESTVSWYKKNKSWWQPLKSSAEKLK